MGSRIDTPLADEGSRASTLLRRARRCTEGGEPLKAMLAVREACFASPEDARLWALYGAACRRASRHDEAKDAVRQAIWLRERECDRLRARSLERLLADLDAESAAA